MRMHPPQASKPYNMINILNPFKMAPKSGFGWFCSNSTFGAGGKTRLESRIKTFKPYFILFTEEEVEKTEDENDENEPDGFELPSPQKNISGPTVVKKYKPSVSTLSIETVTKEYVTKEVTKHITTTLRKREENDDDDTDDGDANDDDTNDTLTSTPDNDSNRPKKRPKMAPIDPEDDEETAKLKQEIAERVAPYELLDKGKIVQIMNECQGELQDLRQVRA